MKRKFTHTSVMLTLTAFSIYVLLDTFVIPRSYTSVSASDTASVTNVTSLSKGETTVTDTSYRDDNISISISTERYEDTTIYVADVTLSDPSLLQTAFANSTYGKNVTASTSEIASDVGAILAINGDFYGAQNSGFVVRNGTVYRTSVRSSDQEDLAILSDGSFQIITEGTTDTSWLESDEVVQVFSFGPALINNGVISVDENDEVGKAMSSNPRTAICEIEAGHYLLVVADGRTDESEGLSLYQFAQFLSQYDVTVAYNLDGGGSSTMVFNGKVINKPTTSGNRISERSVSDIVCIAY